MLLTHLFICENTITEAVKCPTKDLSVSSQRSPIDEEFDRLCALPRRVRRRYRKAPNLEDLRSIRRTKNQIRTHLQKIG